MKVYQFFILQISDVFRFASRVKLILTLLVEVLFNALSEGVIRITHSSLHLIINDTFVYETTIWDFWLLKLQTMSLLSEVKIA